MNRNLENTDDVLVKYLLGEATETEQANVEQWIAAGDENKRYYNHFKLIWDQSKLLAADSNVDENEAWDRFLQKVEKEERHEVSTQPAAQKIPLGKTNWLRAAAALIILLGCTAVYYFTAGTGSTITTQAGSTALATTLPDGSLVTLNRNSSITYPAKFSGSTRHVVLKGEAFFNVTPDKAHPFIIDADASSIKVVGTSFNVKSNDDKTEVVVETGIVEVAKKQFAIRVNPHQKAIVLKKEDRPVMENSTDVLYNYYRTKEFVCDHTPLYKLTDILSEAFDVHIVIASAALRDLPVSSTYHEQSLNAILENIRLLTGATVEKNGNEIIIK